MYKQKYRNLEADLSHAHAIEFSVPAEIGLVQSHKSRCAMLGRWSILGRWSMLGRWFMLGRWAILGRWVI